MRPRNITSISTLNRLVASFELNSIPCLRIGGCWQASGTGAIGDAWSTKYQIFGVETFWNIYFPSFFFLFLSLSLSLFLGYWWKSSRPGKDSSLCVGLMVGKRRVFRQTGRTFFWSFWFPPSASFGLVVGRRLTRTHQLSPPIRPTHLADIFRRILQERERKRERCTGKKPGRLSSENNADIWIFAAYLIHLTVDVLIYAYDFLFVDVTQVWFQNRRAKFRRNERSLQTTSPPSTQRPAVTSSASSSISSPSMAGGKSPDPILSDPTFATRTAVPSPSCNNTSRQK